MTRFSPWVAAAAMLGMSSLNTDRHSINEREKRPLSRMEISYKKEREKARQKARAQKQARKIQRKKG